MKVLLEGVGVELAWGVLTGDGNVVVLAETVLITGGGGWPGGCAAPDGRRLSTNLGSSLAPTY